MHEDGGRFATFESTLGDPVREKREEEEMWRRVEEKRDCAVLCCVLCRVYFLCVFSFPATIEDYSMAINKYCSSVRKLNICSIYSLVLSIIDLIHVATPLSCCTGTQPFSKQDTPLSSYSIFPFTFFSVGFHGFENVPWGVSRSSIPSGVMRLCER